MSANFRLLMLAALVLLLSGIAFAQPLPPSPIPVAPPLPPPGAPPVPPPQAPLQPPVQPAPWQPPPPALPAVPPAPSTGLADPGPNGWGPIYGPPSDVPTFFLGLDLDVVKPVVKDQLHGTVFLPDGTTSTLNVGRADLPWTVSPRFELGYKLPDSLGEFVLGYRFLVSDGSGTLTSDAGDFGVRTRFNMNLLDLDYNCAKYEPGPRWSMQWTVGARIAWFYYDTTMSNDTLSQSASNYFDGAGGHAAFKVERQVSLLPSFGFFAKVDGSFLVGTIHQNFNEATFDANGNLEGGSTQLRKTQSVESLSFQTGISYTPPNLEFLRFELGYEYEHWFSLGRLDSSNLELTTQGAFLRGRFDF
jgi:hypothetical protein